MRPPKHQLQSAAAGLGAAQRKVEELEKVVKSTFTPLHARAQHFAVVLHFLWCTHFVLSPSQHHCMLRLHFVQRHL
eukprot:1223695-Alexandrium_andersonii.AAC.1